MKKASIFEFTNILFKSTSLFLFFVIVTNLLVIKIPFDLLFANIFSDEFSKNISRTIHGVIIVLFSIVLINKFSLNQIAGTKLFFIRKPLLLIVPFIYPMLLAIPNFSKFNFSNLTTVGFIIMIMAIMSKAFAEEFCFRGLIQSYLIKKYANRFSIYIIIQISAIVFALMHTINLVRYSYVDVISQVIFAFYFGVFFGAMLLHIRNVLLIGIIHGCVNFAFNITLLNNPGSAPNQTVLTSEVEAIKTVFLFAVVFFPLWIIGMLMLRKINKKRLEMLINQ